MWNIVWAHDTMEDSLVLTVTKSANLAALKISYSHGKPYSN